MLGGGDRMTTPQGEEERVRSLDDRFGKIEGEQERQGGLLDKILGKLGGGDEPAGSDTTVTRADEPASGIGDMAEQMRQAIRDVNAEAAAAAAAKDGGPKQPDPETTPREVMIRGKERLQRALFGSDPK